MSSLSLGVPGKGGTCLFKLEALLRQNVIIIKLEHEVLCIRGTEVKIFLHAINNSESAC